MEPKKRISDDLDYELWKLLNFVREIIHEVREKELANYGLTIRQAGILYTVINDLGNNAKPAEIARFSKRAPNSVTNILKTMERKGLISKNKDLYKKNVIRVSLTEKGKEALEMANNRRSIHRIFACLSEEEITQTHTYLTRLLDKAATELKTRD